MRGGHTRAFRRGRTETVRTFSLETQEWTHAMEDPKCASLPLCAPRDEQ